jgi:hypothetical protein
VTCQDVFLNLVVEMEARNIFFVLNVAMPPQHIENFSRPLKMTQCQKHESFAGTICFLKAETLLQTSSATDDHEEQGQVTTQNG